MNYCVFGKCAISEDFFEDSTASHLLLPTRSLPTFFAFLWKSVAWDSLRLFHDTTVIFLTALMSNIDLP